MRDDHDLRVNAVGELTDTVLDIQGPGSADALVPEGDYDVYTQRARLVPMKFGNAVSERLIIECEIRTGAYDGARLRFIVSVPPRKRGTPVGGVSASSKLARAWAVAIGRQPTRSDRLALSVFEHKLFRARIRFVNQDRQQTPLPALNRYSTVACLIERIA